MFDLKKWENDHPYVQRFARHLAEVLDSLAEHVIDQASAAVSDALAEAPAKSDAGTILGNALSAPQSAEGGQEDQAAGNAPQAPAQPAAAPVPPEVADWLRSVGWEPATPPQAGPLPSPITDSGGAGVVAAVPGQDVPVTGEPAAQLVPGADVPVWHGQDPADVVGADSHNGPGQ